MEELVKAIQTADLLEGDVRELWKRIEKMKPTVHPVYGNAAMVLMKDLMDKIREIRSTLEQIQ